jgi:phage gp29-like protein
MDVDRIQTILRTAESGNVSELFALYRDILLSDSHLQTEFTKRKLAVLGDPLNFLPVDKAKPEDVAAAAFIKDRTEECPQWFSACSHLLDSVLWPVAVIEKVYRSSTKPGVRFEIADLVVVPDQLLDYTTGKLMIRDTDDRGNPSDTLHEVDPHRYIVHRGHLLTVADNWGGPMRSLVFWWLLSAMDRDWWARFLERYGAPFLVGKYDQGDDASRSVLERAFSFAVKIGGLVVSKETEVEIKQAASSQSADAYEKFLSICQREKSKAIIGQTLSAEAQATGMNSGQAQGQEKVRQDVRACDAMMLGATLRLQLFEQLLRINGLTGRPPKALWGAESYDNAKIIGTLLADLKNAGLEVTDESITAISERLGFTVQRAAAGASSPFALSADLLALAALDSRFGLADLANKEIARNGSAELARMFRGSLAPVRSIVLTSKSAEEVEKRVKLLYADWSGERLAKLITEALEAHAGNAAAIH